MNRSNHISSAVRRLARALIVVPVVAAFVIGPAGPIAADPGDEVTITMVALHFDGPTSITTGTTVIWKNDEVFNYPAVNGTHRVVARDGSFDSGDIPPGGAWSTQILEPGSIEYHCTIHPTIMTGSLTVTGEPIEPEPTQRTVKIVEPSSTDTDSWGYEPEEILVDAGTTITWRNEGAQVHTVTADDDTFDSGDLEPGESFAYTFDAPTALRYHCTPHPWMTGLVQVAEEGGKPPAPPPPPKQEPEPVEAPDQQTVGDDEGPVTFDIFAVEPNIADPDSWGFEPPTLTARVGDSIVWTNKGSTAHTVTEDAGGFDSGTLDAEQTFELELTETGTLTYHCTPHPWMTGTVIVRAATAPAPEQPATPTVPEDPGEGGVEVPDAGDEGEHGSVALDPKAARRTAFTWGAVAFILALGGAMMIPSWRARRRVPPRPAPVEADASERTQERELAGV